MMPYEAVPLVDALAQHVTFAKIDRELFTRQLVDVNVDASSRFSEALPHDESDQEAHQEIDDQEQNHYFHLSIRRVLRNRNARDYRLAGWKAAYAKIADELDAFGLPRIYSSDILTRKLRTDADLVGLLASSSQPHSLLGKLETYDYDNEDEQLFRVTRPLLIVPGAPRHPLILAWEERNITYEAEKGLLFRSFKAIAPDEYTG